MLKVIGFLMLIHSAISLVRYRKHLVNKDMGEDYHIPLDVCNLLSLGLIGNNSWICFEHFIWCNFR